MVPALLFVVVFISAMGKQARIKNYLRIFKADRNLRGNRVRISGPQETQNKTLKCQWEKIVFEEDLKKAKSPRKKWPYPDCHRLVDSQGLDDHSTWPLLTEE